MKMSRRARRMQIHHKRNKNRSASLNMVSLMDIFTILVFFLLVNATSSEVLPTPKQITLPDATAEESPRKNLVIAVNKDTISLQGKPVARVSGVQNSRSQTIQPLFNELKKMAGEVKGLTDTQGVTIMADREIPYELLKKIMLTCQGAEFTRLSFAVNQVPAEAAS